MGNSPNNIRLLHDIGCESNGGSMFLDPQTVIDCQWKLISRNRGERDLEVNRMRDGERNRYQHRVRPSKEGPRMMKMKLRWRSAWR
jgi:hypothetical protein